MTFFLPRNFVEPSLTRSLVYLLLPLLGNWHGLGGFSGKQRVIILCNQTLHYDSTLRKMGNKMDHREYSADDLPRLPHVRFRKPLPLLKRRYGWPDIGSSQAGVTTTIGRDHLMNANTHRRRGSFSKRARHYLSHFGLGRFWIMECSCFILGLLPRYFPPSFKCHRLICYQQIPLLQIPSVVRPWAPESSRAPHSSRRDADRRSLE